MPWTHVNRGERRKSTHGMSGTAGKRERPRTHETHDRTWMEKSGQPPDESLADDTARSKYRRRKAMTYMSSGRSVGLQLVLRSRHAGQGGAPPFPPSKISRLLPSAPMPHRADVCSHPSTRRNSRRCVNSATGGPHATAACGRVVPLRAREDEHPRHRRPSVTANQPPRMLRRCCDRRP